MARTVNAEGFASKRKEILNAAQRLMFTKGYEQMSIQDILDEVGISNGAFHHYFGSREALLNAFIERIRQELQIPLLPIIHDPHLSAIQKLQGFFDMLDSVRMAHQAEITKVARVWYNDANAVVRLKVDEAIIEQRAPLITEVVRQGIREGVFTIPHPEKAGEVILVLLQGMANTHARLLLSIGNCAPGSLDAIVADIVATHVAYMEAVERVLGAPPNSLTRTDAAAVMVWAAMAQEDGGSEEGRKTEP